MYRRIILLLVLVCTGSELYSENKYYNVLVIGSYEPGLPWSVSFQAGLERASDYYDNKIKYFKENLDGVRLGGVGDAGLYREYFESKYKNIRIDALIADSKIAINFVQQSNLYPDIPKVFHAVSGAMRGGNELMMTEYIEKAVSRTVELAFMQNPDADDVLIVYSDVYATNLFLQLIEMSLAARSVSGRGVKIRKVFSKDIDELKLELHNVSEEDLVISTLIYGEKDGLVYTPYDTMEIITGDLRVPVYSFWSSLIGSGIVGGHMIDGETASYQMVRAAIDYVENGVFGDEYICTSDFFDYAALRRAGISTRKIADHAVVANMPYLIFKENYQLFLSIFAVVILAFLVVLIYYNARLFERGQALKTLVSEKELLMREIHHRTKNNLSILQSLVSLQLSGIADSEARASLEDVGSRLSALRLIHEKLYTAKSLKELEMSAYVRELAGQIFMSLEPSSSLIDLQIEAEQMDMDIDIAVSCGLIVNELLTNSMKYAFNEGDAGRIDIKFGREVELIVIDVSNNGMPLPVDFSIESSSGLGLKIVTTLVRQLKGWLEISSGKRTSFRISLPSSSARQICR